MVGMEVLVEIDYLGHSPGFLTHLSPSSTRGSGHFSIGVPTCILQATISPFSITGSPCLQNFYFGTSLKHLLLYCIGYSSLHSGGFGG